MRRKYKLGALMFFKIGHRGAAGYEPENTMRSFEKAVLLGANAIEFDVRRLIDGTPVVIHDATVHRTTNGRGPVSEYSPECLKELDAGKGEKIPLLEEVLERFSKKILINAELKVGGIAEQVLHLLWKYRAAGHAAISAFDDLENDTGDSSGWDELFWMKRKEPDIKIALLAAGEENLERALVSAERVYPGRIWAVNLSRRIVNPARIQRIQKAGARAFVWTVNGSREISRLKTWGVDGIFSDYPDRL